VQRREERRHPDRILVPDRLPVDQPVRDRELRVADDVLEARHRNREHRSKRREQQDLDLEGLHDPTAPWEAEHPLAVDERDLEVVTVVHPRDRMRLAAERVTDQRNS
jgi:hypothetical protein